MIHVAIDIRKHVSKNGLLLEVDIGVSVGHLRRRRRFQLHVDRGVDRGADRSGGRRSCIVVALCLDRRRGKESSSLGLGSKQSLAPILPLGFDHDRVPLVHARILRATDGQAGFFGADIVEGGDVEASVEVVRRPLDGAVERMAVGSSNLPSRNLDHDVEEAVRRSFGSLLVAA